jgi:hypothetical protein
LPKWRKPSRSLGCAPTDHACWSERGNSPSHDSAEARAQTFASATEADADPFDVLPRSHACTGGDHLQREHLAPNYGDDPAVLEVAEHQIKGCDEEYLEKTDFAISQEICREWVDRVAKPALDAGVDERQVRLAESQANWSRH